MYIYNVFREQVSAIVKRWIDTNYKLIRATFQVNFLKTCKMYTTLYRHTYHKIKFYFNHYKITKKFERLLYISKKKILQLEIFYVHRLIDWLTKNLSFLSFNLSNILLTYIWRVIQNFHLKSFNNFHHRLSQEHKNKYSWLLQKRNTDTAKNIKPIRYFYVHTNSDLNSDSKKYVFPEHKLNSEKLITWISNQKNLLITLSIYYI